MYWTNWAVLYDCAICRFLLFLGLFRQSSPRQRPFFELPVLLYNILITLNILEKNWEYFGWFWGESGQKSALPNCIKYGTVLYTYCVFNACFTILNVSEVRMTHPCIFQEVWLLMIWIIYSEGDCWWYD